MTSTVAAPAFPVIIIALVPRLLVMNKIWGKETLRSVDAWACKDGSPEDDEDGRNGTTGGENNGNDEASQVLGGESV